MAGYINVPYKKACKQITGADQRAFAECKIRHNHRRRKSSIVRAATLVSCGTLIACLEENILECLLINAQSPGETVLVAGATGGVGKSSLDLLYTNQSSLLLALRGSANCRPAAGV